MTADATARAAPPRFTGREVLGFALATLATALALAALVSLGVWQLHRKAWKEALLARVAALQTAPAEPLGAVLNRADPPTARVAAPTDRVRRIDFVRVQTLCDGLGERSLHLYGLRAAGPGWRQITACRLPPGGPYGSLLVDLGFENEPPMAGPKVEAVTLPRSAASVVGVLRAPDPPAWTDRILGATGSAPPAASPGAAPGSWLRRDGPAMAAALGASRPAPWFLTLESPTAGPRLVPSPLPSDIPNRHLGYVVTWFGLAAALAGVYLALVVRRLRRPRS